MKNSLMTNVIQFACSGTGTLTSPVSISLYPCGEFITGMVLKVSSNKFCIRLTQDGKQIFPVRTNNPSGYLIPSLSGGADFLLELTGLWVPINPNLQMTVEFCNNDGSAASGSLVLVMASADDRALLVEAIEKGFGKIFAKEAK